MSLKTIHINGFKSFANDTKIHFYHPVTAIVGPNGSGKSNVADAIRFALGEQSMKSMRGGKGEDLIFNGSHKFARKNRAHVALTFDNSNNIFDVDSSEVELQRLVHRDGVNEYLVNSQKTRLKDKQELIASANIGTTGHHMITQGEADKFVTATDAERRLLIEDALGLNLYKLRRREAELKMAKTEEKLKEVNKLVWELEPAVKMLSADVEKLETLQQKEKTLVGLYAEMFYLWQRSISEEGITLENRLSELNNLEKELTKTEAELSESASENQQLSAEEIELGAKRKRVQKDLERLQDDLNKINNELGNLDGSIAQLSDSHRSLQSQLLKISVRPKISTISLDISQVEELHESVQSATSLQAAKQADQKFYTSCVGDGQKTTVDSDLEDHLQEQINSAKGAIESLNSKYEEKQIKHRSVIGEIDSQKQALLNVEAEIQRTSADRLQSVRVLEQTRNKLQSVKTEISSIKTRQLEMETEKTNYEDRRVKVSSIYGRSSIDSPSIGINAGDKISERLRDTKRQVLRLEAQLEDADISDLPRLRVELESEGQRLTHLQTERHDVETTMQRTKELVSELTNQIEIKIEVGIAEVNKNLERFFRVLFGGGSCLLKSVTEDGRRGVAINLQLPYKRIKSVHALSGGERSLASLAILFAITLLSPPPFVVLDETDAALDESNSRRYAKLIRELAEHTQLILITHNRETMTFADELYGVTMGSDGVSRLLSVTLKDAPAIN